MDCTALGVSVNGSVQHCLEQADLAYTVLRTPVRYEPPEDRAIRDVPKHYVTYREDTKEPFGVVKSKYEIIQNSTVYGFLDLVSELEITNAGSLKSGGWLCGKFKDEMILDDMFAPYVFFSNSHDGSSRFIVAFTPVRLQCGSVVNVSSANSAFHFGVRHTQIANHKLRIAQGFVHQSMQAMDDLRKLAESTVSKKYEPSEVAELFERILLEPSGKQGRMFAVDYELLKSCYYEPDVIKYNGTGYGVILAVARFVTHILPTRTRNSESIFHNVLFKTHPLLTAARKLAAGS